ncbi:MAG: DNA primase [Chloroflexi bacterium]|nr:DNA primase [Chloroflexota bacterium]
MSTTDEIKSRIDIVSYVQRFVPSLKKAGRNHKACCPFHTEKTPSFVVNPERQTWHCFGACSEGGDLFTFAQKIHGWDFKEALQELAQEAGVQLRQQTPQQRTRSDELERLRGLLASAAEMYQSQLLHPGANAVLGYVQKKRGLTPETIQTFQFGYAPDSWNFVLQGLGALGHSEDEIIDAGLAVRNDNGRVYDRFRNRLMIPIRDERGRVVGFGGRALNSDDSAKYINSPGTALFDKSRLLFGLDSAKAAIRETGTAVVVEGYMDVIQAYQAGYRNVVAQMGTAMTEAQIRRLAPRYARRIVMALDADEAGQSATRRSLEVARQTLQRDYAGRLSIDIRILQVPSGKDPDDFLREAPGEWGALVESAQDVADFVIDMETAGLRGDATLQARQQLAKEALPILIASEDNLYQRENVQKLARRLRISERDLLAWSQREQAQMPGSGGLVASEDIAPPAMDAELELPPPEYWDNEDDTAPRDSGDSTQTIASTQLRASEPYCLSLLLRNPDLLFQVNRKLRELAGNDENLLNGPLCDLCVEDFTGSQFRILMAHLQEAMSQDEKEPLDYIGAALAGELHAEYRSLLSEEPAAIRSLSLGTYRVDLQDIRSRSRDGRMRGDDLQSELINRALRLRLERLEHERVEMQYLQEEASSTADLDNAHRDQLSWKIMLSMTAKARLDLAVT